MFHCDHFCNDFLIKEGPVGLVSANSALCNKALAGTTFTVVCTLGRAAGIVLAGCQLEKRLSWAHLHEGVLVRVGPQCWYWPMVCWHRHPASPMVVIDDHVNKRWRHGPGQQSVGIDTQPGPWLQWISIYGGHTGMVPASAVPAQTLSWAHSCDGS